VGIGKHRGAAECRRQGIARDSCRSAGAGRALLAERILLEVRASNQAAIRFYETSGFESLGAPRLLPESSGRCNHFCALIAALAFDFSLAALATKPVSQCSNLANVEPTRHRSQRILVVDDHLDNTVLMRELLTRQATTC